MTDTNTETDDLYVQAKGLVLSAQRASASMLQRRLSIGWNAAHQMIERMEADGLVTAPDDAGVRQVRQQPDFILERLARDLADRGATVSRNADGGLHIRIPVHGAQDARPAVSDDRLRLLIERIERLEEEKKGIADDIKDVYAEAKATGYDTRIMREIVRLRKMAPADRREREAVLETYKSAIGLE